MGQDGVVSDPSQQAPELLVVGGDHDDAGAREVVVLPAKVMRIGSMI